MHHYFLEDTASRRATFEFSPEQVKALKQDDLLMSNRNVRSLYLGRQGNGLPYMSCRRLAESYLQASIRVHARTTLVVNGSKIQPKQSLEGVCRWTTFNSFQLGYNESRIFKSNRE